LTSVFVERSRFAFAGGGGAAIALMLYYAFFIQRFEHGELRKDIAISLTVFALHAYRELIWPSEPSHSRTIVAVLMSAFVGIAAHVAASQALGSPLIAAIVGLPVPILVTYAWACGAPQARASSYGAVTGLLAEAARFAILVAVGLLSSDVVTAILGLTSAVFFSIVGGVVGNKLDEDTRYQRMEPTGMTAGRALFSLLLGYLFYWSVAVGLGILQYNVLLAFDIARALGWAGAMWLYSYARIGSKPMTSPSR
jgi:hypothetical protein